MDSSAEPVTQVIGSILFISWWVYCHSQYKKHTLSTEWYMWLIGIMCGLFGVGVYDVYRRKQNEALTKEGTPDRNAKKSIEPDH